MELNRAVTVTEQGKRLRVSKAAVIARQLANKAAGGDLKAVEMLLRHLASGRRDPVGQTGQVVTPTDTDHDILDRALARMASARGEGGGPADDA